MSDLMILDNRVVVSELKEISALGLDGWPYILTITDPNSSSDSKKQHMAISDDVSRSNLLQKAQQNIDRNYHFWLLRRLFNQNFRKKGTTEQPYWMIDTENWKSLEGDENISDREAIKILSQMIKIFSEYDAGTQIKNSELFWSCNLTYSVLMKGIRHLENNLGLLERITDGIYELVKGMYNDIVLLSAETEENDLEKSIDYFHRVRITLEKPFGFILMPFNDSEEFQQSIYKEDIIPYISEKYSIGCFDVRDSHLSNKIDDKLYTCILDSMFVLADLSTSNPNVMYELGMSHCLGKPNIVVTKSSHDNLPFDVKTFDVDKYEDIDSLKEIIDKRIPPIIKLREK